MKTIVGVVEIADELWKSAGCECGGELRELREKILRAVKEDFRDTIPMMTEKDVSALVSGECVLCGGDDEGYCVEGCKGGDYSPPERVTKKYPKINKVLEDALS